LLGASNNNYNELTRARKSDLKSNDVIAKSIAEYQEGLIRYIVNEMDNNLIDRFYGLEHATFKRGFQIMKRLVDAYPQSYWKMKKVENEWLQTLAKAQRPGETEIRSDDPRIASAFQEYMKSAKEEEKRRTTTPRLPMGLYMGQFRPHEEMCVIKGRHYRFNDWITHFSDSNYMNDLIKFFKSQQYVIAQKDLVNKTLEKYNLTEASSLVHKNNFILGI